MSFPAYTNLLNDSLAFIRRMRATGVFHFTARLEKFQLVSDDYYTCLRGTVEGSLGEYVSSYSELEARVFYKADVEYKGVWQYEVNNPWWNADTQTWNDAWSRDISVGTNGLVKGYAPVREDGSFGDIEILEYKTWSHPDGGTYTAPSRRRVLRYFPEPLVRIHRKSDGLLLGGDDPNARIWQGISHSTILWQPDDPNFDGEPPQAGYRLNTRCWIYGEALVALAYLATGNIDEARQTLQRLALEQYTEQNSPSPYYVGGWPFSFDVYFGPVPEQDYLRNGAISWVLWAFLVYQLKTGDTTFMPTIELGLRYLLREQITDPKDNRYGLLPLGWNRYKQPEYIVDYLRESPCSIEHNIDAWQVFLLAYTATGNPQYKEAADLIERALLAKALALSRDHFHQGVLPNGVDDAKALDCASWAGLFLTASQRFDLATLFRSYLDSTFRLSDDVQLETDPSHLNLWYVLTQPVSGYKPYEYYQLDQPEAVWLEGTLGVITLLLRTGKNTDMYAALDLLDNTIKPIMYNIQGPTNGGIISITRAYVNWPWEFTVHPSVVQSAWLIITLVNSSLFWTPRARFCCI